MSKNSARSIRDYLSPELRALPHEHTVEGVATPISTGMTVAAEIKVGKRRIIEFFLYPLIKYFHEGTSVR